LPTLDLGLHVVLPGATPPPDVRDEVERQLERFVTLTGKEPTHLDSHHHVHWAREALPAFVAVAERHRLPLRGHSVVHAIGAFYGLDQIRPDGLARVLEDDVQ